MESVMEESTMEEQDVTSATPTISTGADGTQGEGHLMGHQSCLDQQLPNATSSCESVNMGQARLDNSQVDHPGDCMDQMDQFSENRIEDHVPCGVVEPIVQEVAEEEVLQFEFMYGKHSALNTIALCSNVADLQCYGDDVIPQISKGVEIHQCISKAVDDISLICQSVQEVQNTHDEGMQEFIACMDNKSSSSGGYKGAEESGPMEELPAGENVSTCKDVEESVNICKEVEECLGKGMTDIVHDDQRVVDTAVEKLACKGGEDTKHQDQTEGEEPRLCNIIKEEGAVSKGEGKVSVMYMGAGEVAVLSKGVVEAHGQSKESQEASSILKDDQGKVMSKGDEEDNLKCKAVIAMANIIDEDSAMDNGDGHVNIMCKGDDEGMVMYEGDEAVPMVCRGMPSALDVSVRETTIHDSTDICGAVHGEVPTTCNKVAKDNTARRNTPQGPTGMYSDVTTDEEPVKVSPGSIASTGVSVGDVVLRVGEVATTHLSHNQAQEHLQAVGNLLQLHIAKGGNASPTVYSSQPDQYATRLSQQLANMDMNSPLTPSHYGSSYPDTNGQPAYNSYNSYNNDTHNGTSMYNAPQAPPLPTQATPPSYRPSPTPPPPAIPDAVLNMAAKGGPGKTPFSYVPDADMLKEHRDRVRRRQGANLPHYQNMLIMPNFEDNVPQPVGPNTSYPQQRPASAQGYYGGTSPAIPAQDVFPAGPGSATVAHAQYNSPLGLYSNDNVANAFAGQTDGLITGVRTQGGGGKQSGPDITQSAVYKLIHGLDEPPPDPRPQSRRPAPEGHRPVVRQPSEDDEVSFSGVGRDSAYDHIPSKAFHKLQSLTGGGEVDRSSIRGNVTGVAPSPAGPRRRSLRRAESAPHRPDEEEYEDRGGGVDLSYVGSSIPSRTFRMLQRSVGADPNDYDSGVQNGMEDPVMVGPSDGTQPSTEEQTRAARERRRRRRRGSASLPRQVSSSPVRRPILPTTQPHEAQPSNFDEDAYLAGRVPIVRSEEELQSRPVVGRSRSVRAEPDDEIPPENLRSFDEHAFLAGQVSVLGDPNSQSNLPPRVPKKKEFSVRPDWAHTVARKKKVRAFERSTSQVASDRLREQEKASMQYINQEETPQRNFDEKAFLAGQIGIFDETPKAPRTITNENKKAVKTPYEFQRIAQRRASIDFLDPLKRAQEGRDFPMLFEPEQDTKADSQEPFDERAFLQGMVPVVSETKVPTQVPSWVKKAPKADPDCFEEKAYLTGRIPLIGEGTPDLRPVNRQRKKKPAKADVEHAPVPQEPFDEQAFLAGKVAILGGSLDETAPPRLPRKKVEKHYAEWERPTGDEDETPDDNAHEFDERQFLQGRVPIIRGASESPRIDPNNQRIPSKSFLRLTRSVSRDSGEAESDRSRSMSPATAQRRQMELQMGTSKDIPMEELKYTGTEIPGKAFARLQSQISRSEAEAPPKDPIERLRRNSLTAKQKPAWEEGCVDAEKVLEVMDIKEHSPDRFFDAMEDIVKGNEPKMNGLSEQVAKPTAPPSQRRTVPKVVVPPSQQTNAPKAVVPPSQQTNVPKTVVPPSQQTNTPKSAVPPSQQTNTPKAAVPQSQQTNIPKVAEASCPQGNTVTAGAPPSAPLSNVPKQQMNATPPSPTTGGIKVISRSISQEPTQQPIQPAQQPQQAPKQQVQIQPPKQQVQIQPLQAPKQQVQNQPQQPQVVPQQPEDYSNLTFEGGEDQVTDF